MVSVSKKISRGPTPIDMSLYNLIKARVKMRIPVHSAYRSGIIVSTYKKAFAKKYGLKKSPYSGSRTPSKGLSRWFKEKWRNQRGKVGYQKQGDIYRPTVRITRDTPVTMGELSRKQLRRASKEKATRGRVSKFKKK